MVKVIVDNIEINGTGRRAIEAVLEPKMVKDIIQKIPLDSGDFDSTEIYILANGAIVKQIKEIIGG